MKIEKNNSYRLRVRREDEVILNVPAPIGIIGGMAWFLTEPMAVLAGTIATFGLGLRVEIVKRNGFSGYEVVEDRDHLYIMLNK